MSKKPSLGHNPLAYSLKSHASFDFIKSTQNQQKEAGKNDSKSSPKKKVVSYYLEQSLIDQIRNKANEEKKTYSYVAGKLLKESIEKENTSE